MHTISEPHYDTEILKYHHLSPFPPSLTKKNIDYADFLGEKKAYANVLLNIISFLHKKISYANFLH